MRIRLAGKLVEMISWRMRRRAVRRSLNSLRKHLSQLEQGGDVDVIGVKIYRDIASIELHNAKGGPCPGNHQHAGPASGSLIWVTGLGGGENECRVG